MPASDPPSIVAVDLGAESCRVSLLQWNGRVPHIELVHRFSNAPVPHGNSLHWDLDRILSELKKGLLRCAEKAPIAAIGVDGWAVDYVRLGDDGAAIAPPFCYRDDRTKGAEVAINAVVSRERLYSMTGVQPMRINTLYQLKADQLAGAPAHAPWVNLPEYVLARLGGRVVAEYTNATHTGLVDAATRRWNSELLDLCGLDPDAVPELVPTGSETGRMNGDLGRTAAFRGTRLIAPACHDTASAIAGMPMSGGDWAYISSGTWSLVGVLIDRPINTPDACAAGFTNLGAGGDRICFHKNLNGMWLLKQTMAQLCMDAENGWPMAELIAAAEYAPPPEGLLDIDDPELLMQGPMATRINSQRVRKGLSPIEEHRNAMPRFASLIFHSLAQRYAEVLRSAEALAGKKLKRIVVVGGGSLNGFLNRLTAEATGLEVVRGAAESSTIGNFAVQLAALEGLPGSVGRIAHWSAVLSSDEHP